MSAPEDPASLPGSPLIAYIRALRAHPVVIIAVIVVAVGATAAFTRTRTYDATTEILVTPISPQDRSFVSLPLPRAVGTAPTIVQTEASIVDSPEAAALTAKRLSDTTPNAVRNSVAVTASATSNIVNVTAGASDPDRAAAIANTYARSALAVRKRTLRPLVVQAIQSAQKSLADVPDPNSETAQVLRQRLVDLRSLQRRRGPHPLAESSRRPAIGSGRSLAVCHPADRSARWDGDRAGGIAAPGAPGATPHKGRARRSAALRTAGSSSGAIPEGAGVGSRATARSGTATRR